MVYYSLISYNDDGDRDDVMFVRRYKAKTSNPELSDGLGLTCWRYSYSVHPSSLTPVPCTFISCHSPNPGQTTICTTAYLCVTLYRASLNIQHVLADDSTILAASAEG